MRLRLCGILGSTAVSLLALPMARAAAPDNNASLSLAPSVSQTVPSPVASADPVADAYSPLRLAIVDEPESVYPQSSAPQSQEPVNAGSVNFDLTVSYLG